MRAAMFKKVNALNIAHRFVFPGFLHEIEKHFLLSASDVYVMPSVSEPFGIVALEAMQYALPVIVSNQSGVAEIVNHATKVDYFNIDALAKAILKFICDPELSINNGKEAQREAQKHGWDKSASLLREVYVNVNKR
jgi:glycosyltransferase involved in cell wall biosynthesis